MAVSLLPWLDQFFTNSDGNPLAGGSVETYVAGTSTPKNTWSDPSGTVLNANPIPLNASGRPVSGGIYGTIGEAYKIIVKDALGVEQQCSRDNVFFPAIASGGGSGGNYITTDTEQLGLTGKKQTSGEWTFDAQMSINNQATDNAPAKVFGRNAIGQVVETDPSVFLSTTAGILDTIFFTGDTTTLSSGTYYQTQGGTKGTIALIDQSLTLGDNQKLFFAQDLISEQITGAAKVFSAGTYRSQLSVMGVSLSAQQKFTIEVYATDANGVPYASGVTGAPVGALGVQVMTILDTGNIDLINNNLQDVGLTGFLNEAISVPVGNRIRLHVSGEKVGTAGANIELHVYYGYNANSYVDIPASITSTMVENLSNVAGDNVTQALDNVIAKDGTTETTAPIPFAEGVDIVGAMAGGEAMRLPDGGWIRPQTPGQAFYLTTGTTPGTIGAGALHLQPGQVNLYSKINDTTESGYVFLGSDSATLQAKAGGTTAGYVSVLPTQTQYYHRTLHQFTGAPMQLSYGTGSATQLLGINASNHVVLAGTAPSGGFMGLSGHNDLGTTPWSFGDNTTWALSNFGMQIDPTGTYGAWIKGNLLIDQGVSNALTLYRQDFNIGSTTCVYYDAQDSLGAQSRYAEHCAQIASNTAGSVQGEWYVKTAIAGVMTERIRATALGGLLTGAWSASGSIRGGTPNVGSITGWTPTVWATANTSAAVAAYANDGTVNLRCLFGAETTGKVVFDYDYGSIDLGYSWRRLGVELMSLSKFGKLALLPSTASSAMLNIGAFGVTVTSPVDGDIWKAAADSLCVRMSTNTRTVAWRESSNTWGGTQQFNNPMVVNATTASTTAGAIYRRTNYGHVGYEAGMAQEFLGCVYVAPIGTALTNSTTATDINGGTAQFGTRAMSTTIFQIATRVQVKTKLLFTNSAANTLTLTLRDGSTSGTVLGTVTLNAVVSSKVVEVVFDGNAIAAPGASVTTYWTASVGGSSTAIAGATFEGSATALATNALRTLVVTAQWQTALATSSVQQVGHEIVVN